MNEMDTRFANQFNIQWFPGHMTKTLRMMEQEIQHVDAALCCWTHASRFPA